MYCCAKPNLDETRTVLIIGGGNGIGYCLTQTLLEKTTDNVISCDIDIKSSLQNLHHQTQQKDASNRFHISSIDVTDPVSVQKCIDYIKTIKVARIDRVVLSCGVFKGAPLLEISDEDFISVMNVQVQRTFSNVVECTKFPIIDLSHSGQEQKFSNLTLWRCKYIQCVTVCIAFCVE
eukprot:408021_1